MVAFGNSHNRSGGHEKQPLVVTPPRPLGRGARGRVDLGHLVDADDGVPGAESLPVGLEHEHLDVVVVVGPDQSLVHVPHLLRRLDVGLVGSVEDDAGHRPVLLVDDRLELHSLHNALPSARPSRPAKADAGQMLRTPGREPEAEHGPVGGREKAGRRPATGNERRRSSLVSARPVLGEGRACMSAPPSSSTGRLRGAIQGPLGARRYQST